MEFSCVCTPVETSGVDAVVYDAYFLALFNYRLDDDFDRMGYAGDALDPIAVVFCSGENGLFYGKINSSAQDERASKSEKFTCTECC